MAYAQSMALCWAASQGDINEMCRLVANGYDLNAADYDGRTAIHLAASNGQTQMVKYLFEKQVNMNPRDRWEGTPLKDAKREGHSLLYEWIKAKGGIE